MERSKCSTLTTFKCVNASTVQAGKVSPLSTQFPGNEINKDLVSGRNIISSRKLASSNSHVMIAWLDTPLNLGQKLVD